MSAHPLPVGFDSLVAGIRCAAVHATDAHAAPACRNSSRRRVRLDARKAQIRFKGFTTASPPQIRIPKRGGPLHNQAILGNTFGKGTPTTVPEIKDSIQSMIADVEGSLVALRAALERGSRKEATALKGSIRDGFAMMTAMAKEAQKMLVKKMELEVGTNGSLDELIALGHSMDSMRDQTVRIGQELDAMRSIVPTMADRLSPEVLSLVEDAEILEWAAGDELTASMPDVANSIQSACQDLRDKLAQGEDGATELKSILDSTRGAKVAAAKGEGSEYRWSVVRFESKSLATFLDNYSAVFGDETVSEFIDAMKKEEVELELLDELWNRKGNAAKDAQGADKSGVDAKRPQGQQLESSELAAKNVIEAPPAPTETRKPLGDFIPSRSAPTAFTVDKVVDNAFREGHQAAPGGGGIDDNSNNGGGGGGGGGGGDEPVEATAMIWAILLMMIGYGLLLSLMLDAHIHFQKFWRQFWSRYGWEDSESGGDGGAEVTTGGSKNGATTKGGVDDGNESDGGGVAYGGGEPVLQRGGSAGAAMSMKSRALMKASASKEPKTGYVLTGSLFLISVVLTKALGSVK